MNIVISGATGLIGTALTRALTAAGHNVYGLARSPQSSALFHWWPPAQQIHFDPDIPVDAVINLAGAGIADKRWNDERKREIKQSRIMATRLLAEKMAAMRHPPQVFISASALGYYGDTGDQAVTESSAVGEGFLAEVARDWEQAAAPAVAAGIRTLFIRTGIVLSTEGGALQQMLLPFRLGLGGIIADGRQYMSWISLRDEVEGIRFLLEHPGVSGPVNLVAPNPVSNRAFTKTLGKVLHRPTLIPLPAAVVKLVFGEMGEHLLLTSTRVQPRVLEQAGYRFLDPTLRGALENLLQ
ncbi:MAG: TIGR01777 family oxidoreductase [Pseudomonadota bacterium]|nr:TIGR01777 family protein [Pseudomonadales bacterium]MDY6919390.1 TIGR01777 family oxidoreductase [Pseudomonadota bacterium]